MQQAARRQHQLADLARRAAPAPAGSPPIGVSLDEGVGVCGKGGQSVNTTYAAVRLTRLPTNTVVQCQDERSQYKNKDKALRVLRARLLDAKVAAQNAEIAANRKSQVGQS